MNQAPPQLNEQLQTILQGFGQALLQAQSNIQAHLQLPKPPTFDGKEAADLWLFQVETFLVASKVESETFSIAYASQLLQGTALRWWQSFPEKPNTWNGFKEVLLARFAPLSASSARDAWSRVRQTSTLEEYISCFSDTMARVTDASEGERVQRFKDGLKPALRNPLSLEDPTTFQEAVRKAILLNQRIHYLTPSPAPAPAPMEVDSIKLQPLTPEERERLRKLGLCFRCRAGKHQAKDCPKKTSAFYPSSVLNSSPSSRSSPSSPSPSSRSSLSPPSPSPSLRLPNRSSLSSSSKCRSPSCHPSSLDPLLASSLTSATEFPLVTLPIILPNGREITALLDSGASANFAQHTLIDELSLTSTPTSRQVALADGSLKGGISLCHVPLEFLGIKDEIPCFTAPIARPLILGRPWLAKWNPTINWKNGKIFLPLPSDSPALPSASLGSISVPLPPPSPSPPSSPAPDSLAPHPQLNPCPILNSDLPSISSNVPECPAHIPAPAATALPSYPFSAFGLDIPIEEGENLILAVITDQPPSPDREDPDVKALLAEFQDIFYDDLPPGPPPARDSEFKIDLIPDSKPPARPPFRLSFAEQEELQKQISQLLEKGFIRPSKSPFGAPVMFVKKKDGSFRMVIDYRRLNDITIRNNYPLPLIDELLDQLRGSHYFSSLDMVSGYWQQKVAEKDVEKTAFTTKLGHFEFLVLPFGLKNAPSAFMKMVNDILQPYLGKFVLAYLDDILIFSKTKEEHLRHLRLILDLFRKHRLYAKPKKCEFMKTEINFLGHRVSPRGISTVPNKVKTIQDWQSPSNVPQLRSFLGLATYYQRFVQNFSDIASPLTNLLKKNIPYSWGEEEQKAFDTLKKALTTAPVLRLPDPTQPFILHTDASNYAIGAVISQEDQEGERPIAFTSRKLLPAETRYPVHEKELLAIIHALRHWRHYLFGSKIKIFTDHHSIKYFKTQPTLSQRQARWLETLEEFDLEIIYKPGKTNVVADALSRYNLETEELLSTEIVEDLLAEIKTSYKTDAKAVEIIDQIKQGTLVKNFRLKDDLLYYISDHRELLYIPDNDTIKRILFRECHDSVLSGHFGFEKTLDLIQRSFFWPKMRQEVQEYTQSCLLCQKNKSSNQAPAGLLHPLEIPTKPWDHVSMDLIVQLPLTKAGFDAILVQVDKLTKMVHFSPTKTNATAPDLAKIFFKDVVRLHGLPQVIISDRDARFTSNFWRTLYTLLDTRLAMSTAFHPQTDGQTERTNRTLEQMLRFFVNYKQDNWDDLLPALEFAVNNTTQSSTKNSPFYLNYGFDPRTPHSLLHPGISPVPAVNDYLTEISSAISLAKDNLKRAQDHQAKYANTHRRELDFQEGEEVLLSTANFIQEAMKFRPSKKLTEKFIGPYKIIKMISPVAAKLDLPPTMKIHPVFHVSLLKKIHYRPTRFQQDDPPEPPIVIHDQEEYEVEEILDKEERKRGKGISIKYLVKWKGYPLSDATWEPLSNLENAKEAIKEYEALKVGENVE